MPEGNGPSAIFLSLLLSGHVPYFNGNLKNTALELKLEKDKRSIIEQASVYIMLSCITLLDQYYNVIN